MARTFVGTMATSGRDLVDVKTAQPDALTGAMDTKSGRKTRCGFNIYTALGRRYAILVFFLCPRGVGRGVEGGRGKGGWGAGKETLTGWVRVAE